MYLIIGASSFIGRHLFEYCKTNDIDVVGTYYMHTYNKEWIPYNICEDNLIDICKKYLFGNMPNVVIICSANTSIDSCKKDEILSNYLNVTSTQKLIDQIGSIGAKCIFLSSEAVFDGKKGMYLEEDLTVPATLYGRQKLQIEKYIIKNLTNYIIFRISRAVGSSYGEDDIFKEFYTKIISNQEIICLKNQSFCLTEVSDIAKIIIKALIYDINGLYHLASSNYISRFDLANLYAEKIFGKYEKIIEKEYKDIQFLDNRHIYGGLNGNRLQKLLNIDYMSIHEILHRYLCSYSK